MLRLCVCAASLFVALLRGPGAAAAVVVVKQDGQVVRAEAISPSPRGGVTLRSGNGRVAVQRHLSWNSIRLVQLGGETFTGRLLREHYAAKGFGVGAAEVGGRRSEIGSEGGRSEDSAFAPRSDRGAADLVVVRGAAQEPRAARLLQEAGLPLSNGGLRRSGFSAAAGVRGHSESPLVSPGRYACECVPCAIPTRRLRDARVLGVREGPLSAYEDLLERHYPFGVPLPEVPFALHLMREAKARQVLGVPPPAIGGGIPAGGHPEANASGSRNPEANASGSRNPEADASGSPNPEANASGSPGREIRAIGVSAVPVNLHGKADADALAVHIRGFDGAGVPVPVRGTMVATLRGRRQRPVRPVAGRLVTQPLDVTILARWSKPIGPAGSPGGSLPTRGIWGLHYAPPPATLRLPLPLSADDLRNPAVGRLYVKLVVPGNGVFEASSAPVLLRPPDRLRDRNQIETGSRFFAGETTHGRREVGGLRMTRPSAVRPSGRVLTVQP